MSSQPPTELVFGASLQIETEDGATVVGVRTQDGDWLELKRIPPTHA